MILQDKFEASSMKSWKGVKDSTFYLVQTKEQFELFYSELSEQKLIAIDTETTGLEWYKNEICGFVFGWGKDRNFYIPVRHEEGEQLPVEYVVPFFKKILEDPEVSKVLWNTKFDKHMLANEGLYMNGLVHDGIHIVHLLDENSPKALKFLSCKFIDSDADSWEKLISARRQEIARAGATKVRELIKEVSKKRKKEWLEELNNLNPVQFASLETKEINAYVKAKATKEVELILKENEISIRTKKDEIPYSAVSVEDMAPYAAADVYYTLYLYKKFLPNLIKSKKLINLLKHETEFDEVLFDVERTGIYCNIDHLNSLREGLWKEIEAAEQNIYDQIGQRFEMTFNEQLATALLTAGIPLTKLTKGGKKRKEQGLPILPKHYSTDVKVFEYLSAKYQFANDILKFRELKRKHDAYVVGLPKKVDNSNYLHTSYNSNLVTGRISSRNPNIQNITNDKELRAAFEIDDPLNYYMLFMDYSQIEIRLTAHHSQDPKLIEAYPFIGQGQDVHSMTCVDVVMDNMTLDKFLNVYTDEEHELYDLYKIYRSYAKIVNFGIIYGISDVGLVPRLSTPERPVSQAQCEKYINNYFNNYVKVKEWIDRITFQIKRSGEVENTFGRVRRLPEAITGRRYEQSRAGRQAVNFLAQGDAADIMKTASRRIRSLLMKKKAKTKLVNFVHDEFQFYIHKKELDLIPELKHEMENFPQFKVPIKVDVEISKTNWADKKTYKSENFIN